MPRYEEMDQILQRIRARSQEPEAPEAASTAAESVPVASLRPIDQGDAAATVQELLRGAQYLRQILAPERVRLLSHEQHDELLTLMGKVLQEMWKCEVALQRVAPYE